ncbi:MAG: aspartate ammonia-lyase, partial [Thermoanaerobacterium sp.]|nr:aspartate ammonia-lyase [Thermoanaerobacterium sp.]
KNAIDIFINKCIKGIKANRNYLKEMVENSLSYAIALSPYIGYEKASLIAKEAKNSGKTIREVAKKYFSEDQLDVIFNEYEMTKPGIPGLKRLRGEDR